MAAGYAGRVLAGAAAAALALSACGGGGGGQAEADGLPDRAESLQAPAAPPTTPAAASPAEVSTTPVETAVPPEATGEFSVAALVEQMPLWEEERLIPSVVVADMAQVREWVGPIEEIWIPEGMVNPRDEDLWFVAANMRGADPPREGEVTGDPDFILGLNSRVFGDGTDYSFGMPLQQTRAYVQSAGRGGFQAYALLEPGVTLPNIEDLGEGLYMMASDVGSDFGNTPGYEYRVAIDGPEVLITRSTVEARGWLDGQTANTIGARAPAVLDTARLLDGLSVALAHIYPAGYETRLDQLRYSVEDDRDERMEEYLNQVVLDIPCAAAAVGWFDEGGEARELVAYHFGDSATAAAAARDVEATWDNLYDFVRVRDIRQEGPVVYAVLDDPKERGGLALVVDGQASRGEPQFYCLSEGLATG